MTAVVCFLTVGYIKYIRIVYTNYTENPCLTLAFTIPHQVSLADLETLFGLAVVTVSSPSVAATSGLALDTFPAVLLFTAPQTDLDAVGKEGARQTRFQYQGGFDGEDVAIGIRLI